MRRFPVLTRAFKLTLLFLVLSGLFCKNEKLSICREDLGMLASSYASCIEEKRNSDQDCVDTLTLVLFQIRKCEELKNKPQVQP